MMIGFIGLGKMGYGMASNLLSAGHEVTIFARNSQAAGPILKQGAFQCDSPAALAAICDTIFTMVGGPDDVESLYLGKDGLLLNAKAGTCLIDMTSSSEEMARIVYSAGSKCSVHTLDAPVTGGTVGANSGSLTIMVGGDLSAFERVKPLFDVMGDQVMYMGDAGAGQTAKSCNQIAVAGIILGMTEALNLAHTKGISVENTFQILSSGTASSGLLKTLGKKMMEHDTTASFSISQFIKDLKLATELAAQNGDQLSTVDFCLKYCESMEEAGSGQLGLQVLQEYYKSGHSFTRTSFLKGS